MRIRITVLSLLFIFCASLSEAQTHKILGTVADANDKSPLEGARITISKGRDSAVLMGTAADADGHFEFDGLEDGGYRLKVEYMGFNSLKRFVKMKGEDQNIGTLSLSADNKELKNVNVAGKQVRAKQMGDTSQFNADAYKTHPDATAEDLVNKMPGVTAGTSGVTHNGESVKQVTVDGKPFFGSDPSLALKNLPSEVVDKIQFFDKMSDQAQFTGFDDGNSQKTMNIVTRRNKSEGTFGKAFAGAGTDDRYTAGGNYNSFQGERRISVIGLFNNINQQNFSFQDILGVSGGGGGRGGGFGGGFGGGGGGGGFGGSNFFVGQQSGITTTNSIGLNYSDQWGKNCKISASYFFNNTDNLNQTLAIRNYNSLLRAAANDTNALSTYIENSNPETKNFNHRFNLRLEYTFDSMNSLIFTPNASLQNNFAYSPIFDSSLNSLNTLLSTAGNQAQTNTNGYNYGGNLLLQHKMKKKGRTIALGLNGSNSYKKGDGYNNTLTGRLDSTNAYDYTILNQNYNSTTKSLNISPNLTYTEPLGKNSQLMLNYNPSVTYSDIDKQTDTNQTGGTNYEFDPTLSNKYKSTYTVERGGLNYRYNNKNMNFSVGSGVQSAVLDGSQTFPAARPITRTFNDVLPNLFMNYKFDDGRNLRVVYRTSINAPSISQLQELVDVSNPLQLSTGNKNLIQDYEHFVMVRYGQTKAKNSRNFFLFANANYITNYIGNATYTNTASEIAGGVVPTAIPLIGGAQLTVPVNLNYYLSSRLFGTYSIPMGFIKSNLNLNGGASFTHTPGLYNNQAIYSENTAPTAGIVISSNISEKLDFTFSYTGNYNFVKNSIQTLSNSDYYSHTAGFKANWNFWKGFVVNTDISHNYYSTFTTTSGNVDFWLWNAYLGYKFLKKKSLEARIVAYDILNQNKSITRTVTATYVENDQTKVLKQYFLFQLTYTLRNFKMQTPDGKSPFPMDGMFRMRGGPGGPPPDGQGPPPGMHMHGEGPGGGF